MSGNPVITVPPNIAPILPPFGVAFPLLAAAALGGMRKHLSRRACDTIVIFVAALDTIDCATLLYGSQTQTLVYWFGNWFPRGSMVLGIDFVIDPLAATLATLSSLLGLLALVFSWSVSDSGHNHFQPLMLVFLAGMTGFCLTGDLFNMFVFFELMSTAAFALTGLKTHEQAPLQGAFNFAVTNTIAGFMVLTGIAFLYAVTGALNMAQIGLLLVHRHDSLVLVAFTLITCGFFTKAAVVPFQFWLADAHAVSPTAVCVLFSGIMVELGLYAVERLYAIIFVPALDSRGITLRTILLLCGAVTAVYGGFMCYAEHHIKRLLAFSTISHSGLMLLAIALQTPLAIGGFCLYLLGHAFVKSGLFFVSGILLHRNRTASEPLLFARGRKEITAGVLWFLGGLGLAGVPGFLTVGGEALTSNAAEHARIAWVSTIFVISGVFTAGAVFRVGFHTFLGWGSLPISDRSAQVDEAPETRGDEDKTPWNMIAAATICVALGISLTFVPGIRTFALHLAERLCDYPGYLHAVYLRQSRIPASPAGVDLKLGSSVFRGILGALLAILLSLTSVFRLRLKRPLRIGAFLEGRLLNLRALQSGHVGDYVAWMTFGTAVIGAAYVCLLC